MLWGRKVYWSNESGITYVVEVVASADGTPTINLLAENLLAQPILASPAASGDRLLIRTTSALYCIAGDAPVTPVAENSTLKAGQPQTLEALKADFHSHPAEHGPDVQVRLDIVEAASRLTAPDLPQFLLQAARDPQWDVSTAAAKALARLGPAAADQLDDLLRGASGQEYLNVIAAEALGEMCMVQAAPKLIQCSQLDYDPTVRVASLHALARIGADPRVQSKPIIEAVLQRLGDKEAAVRVAAIECAGTLMNVAGEAARSYPES